MPRNKKNKGNSGSAPAPNKAKSPAETKVVESAPVAVAAPVEADTSNDELKARLVNAKERLHLLQEVIVGIGDPRSSETGIDAAKDKLSSIQDTVDSVKATLLEVRQETARSVTPEGSQSGTNKRKKNKKHQNQNPPQGFVARQQPESVDTKVETKPKSDASENEGSAKEQEDGTSTISKKKRNRNRKKKGQQEQSPDPEALPQVPSVVDEPVAIPIDEPKTETKENTPEGNKSKNNKKNNKKGQQGSPNVEKVETGTTVVEDVKPAVLEKDPVVEARSNNQAPSNNKNKNKNKKPESASNPTEKCDKNTDDQKNKSKIEDDAITESKADKPAGEISKEKPTSGKGKQDSPPQKENQKKAQDENAKAKDQTKPKNDQKKEQIAEEKPIVSNENVSKSDSSKAPPEKNVKTTAEPQKLDSPKSKKDKKKGQATDSKQSPCKVEEQQTEAEVVEVKNTAPKDEVKNTQPLEVKTPQIEKDSNQIQAAKPEEKVEKAPAPIEEKKVSDATNSQCQKNKKNKQQVPTKTSEKPIESPIVEQVTEKISTEIQKEEGETVVESPIKEKCSAEALPCIVQAEAKAVSVDKKIISQVSEVAKATSPEDLAVKIETPVAPSVIPTLPKLDFSQVVKDNKDKIPLMEIKVSPVKTTETTDETKPTELATKPLPELSVTDKPLVDSVKAIDVAILPTSTEQVLPKKPAESKPIETTSKPTSEPVSVPKPVADEFIKDTLPTADVSVADTVKSKIDAPTPTGSDAATSAKQNKAKTPERKGNQVNVKNEQKKQPQVKGQSPKQKQNDQKQQPNKKDDVKQSEIAKVDPESIETSAVPEKPVAEKAAPEKTVPDKVVPQSVAAETVVPEKIKIEPAAAISLTENKPKEEVAAKNVQKEQPKPDERKLDTKPAPKVDTKEKEGSPKKTDEKQSQIVKPDNKAPISPISPDTKAKTPEQAQVKENKPEGSTSQTAPQNQPPQKQEQKTELSKKDQKKQNKMKGKAPQPPDIPMDMSLLSASMIDPTAADELISHEESEDQSSLITSDSKNVAGSDFVPSVDSSLKVTADATKSLESTLTAPNNQNKVTEIEREAKSSSPSSSKRNKDTANLKESGEMQETKTQELPEKSAQQKLEPVQFPPVKLMDILEAKMTSPSIKPGNVAGNVRKLPRDNKRTDQLNVQQQKSRSKSPKENMAEKYVKNQKLASGDSKKQATQNLKNEILKADVGAVMKPISKEKEVTEPTVIDANLDDSKLTSGTTSTKSAVIEAEQVGNLKESDAVGKQKAEPLPKDASTSDSKSQQSTDDGKTGTAVGAKNESSNNKPKIAPKPVVASKSPPKVTDRSKKSPVKTTENKTPGKDSPGKETTMPSKTPAQSKPIPQSKSSAKPSPQVKSPSKPTSPQTSTPKSPPLQNNDPQCAKKPEVPPKPNVSKTCPNKTSPAAAAPPAVTTPPPIQDEEEEFVEYKFSPRPVFIATACQICKVPLDIPNPCKLCQMVSYCCDAHEKEDQLTHGPLCSAIQEIAKKRGGHIYNNARILNDDDYRSLRVHTLNLCENFVKRHLMPFEREILLFPRLCCTGSCREWRQQSLIECQQCRQVSYCAAHPEHLPPQHEQWCNSFNLYQKIVLRQKNFGRIEPSLPSKIMLKPLDLSDNIDNVFKILYKNYGAIKDECIYATLTQLATAPLTALYAAQKNQQEIGEVYTIHLVGAELQFEADTLDKWETFFLHLVPTLVECRVVFVGPELNAENLPLEILSRIRMCRTCRQNCRIVKFDFQCGMLYHDYANSSAFTKPDLVCFFNPGLYRTTGFNGLDTWPLTIKSAASMNCPILVTSYTEVESPRDFDRIQKESDRPLTVVQPSHINPFASQRPERNFISDEVAPMIFKNFFCFCVK
ncbi:titin-like [Bradysia coprophila]|uniref:titin-like n=1 Tax=Bradysia coprophila TaxID=38358 RepID=UPI00187D7704|nr:titin-like [Bradysia coprophila]